MGLYAFVWNNGARLALVILLLFALRRLMRWMRGEMRRQHERFLLRYLATLSQSHEGCVVTHMLGRGRVPRYILRGGAMKDTGALKKAEIVAAMGTASQHHPYLKSGEDEQLRYCVREVAQRLSWLWRFYDPHAARAGGYNALDVGSHPVALIGWLHRFMPNSLDTQSLNDIRFHMWAYLEAEVPSTQREGLKHLIRTASAFRTQHLDLWELMQTQIANLARERLQIQRDAEEKDL